MQYDTDYYVNIEWPVQSDLFTRLAKFSIMPDTSDYAPVLYWRAISHSPALQARTSKRDGALTMEIHNLPALEEEDFMPPENLPARSHRFFLSRAAMIPRTKRPINSGSASAKSGNDRMENSSIRKERSAGRRRANRLAQRSSRSQAAKALCPRAANPQHLLRSPRNSAKRRSAIKTKENNNVEDVLKRGYGDATEINELMIGFARAAGFESSRAYVAPRNNNAFYPTMEDTTQLAANIVWVKLGKQDRLSRSSLQSFTPILMLPWYRDRRHRHPPR